MQPPCPGAAVKMRVWPSRLPGERTPRHSHGTSVDWGGGRGEQDKQRLCAVTLAAPPSVHIHVLRLPRLSTELCLQNQQDAVDPVGPAPEP